MKRVLRMFAASALAAGAAATVAVSGAQAAGTPGWRFAALYPQVQQMLSVSASSATSAWAVGQTGNGSCDMCLFTSHWNGTKWVTIAEPDGVKGVNNIVDGAAVAATAEGRAWIFVSRENDELGSGEVDAVEWRGRSWSAAHKFAGSPGDPIASGPDDVWGFGSDNGAPWAVHYNGKSWSGVSIPVSVSRASGSAAAGDWLTGTVAAQPALVEVLHWSKGAWRNVPLPKISMPNGDQMLPGTIAAAAAASVWATVRVGPVAGRGPGTTVLLDWNGKAWAKVPVPAGVNLAGLASDGHGGAWVTSSTYSKSGAITGLVMYHYSGGRWTNVPGPAKSGCVYQFAGNLALIPGTRSVLQNATMFPCRDDAYEGAIIKYGS